MSFSLFLFRPSGFFTQRPRTNGGMQRYYFLLVMLESQPHLSFCVRAFIVFVCHCRQTKCWVVWRTQLSPQPPSPLSIPPTSLHSQLTHLCLPLLIYPPLFARLIFSHWLLSPSLYLFKADRLLFYLSSVLYDLSENSFRCCSTASQFLSSFRYPFP